MGEKSRRFGDFTYQEICQCAQQDWLTIIPTDCTEQQGPHLPVDFDTWFAETLMVAAAEKAVQDYAVQAPVLPTIPYGPTPEHRHFGSGFIDLPFPSTMRLSKKPLICCLKLHLVEVTSRKTGQSAQHELGCVVNQITNLAFITSMVVFKNPA
jgi:hypothetical protein